MAPSISARRELEIASSKRPSTAVSGSDLSESESESASSFETTSKPSRKPVKKKARTAKTIIQPIKDEVVPKIPKQYQSEEGNALFSLKWYKEVTKRDAFWSDFQKKMPKAVWAKRFKIEVVVGLNDEGAKGELPATTPKPRTLGPRKNVRKPTVNTSDTNVIIHVDVGEETMASTGEVARNGDQISQLDTTMTDNDATVVGPTEPVLQTTAGTVATTNGDDDLSRLLADPNLSPEARIMYTGVKKNQERIAKAIDDENEQKRQKEANREKRAAAKERKIIREAEAAASADAVDEQGDSGEVAGSDIDGDGHKGTDRVVEEAEELEDDKTSGQKEKMRKEFSPTMF